VRVAYLVQIFGLSGLLLAGYRFCENVHADCHCDLRDTRLAVHLCPNQTDGVSADCVEPSRALVLFVAPATKF